MKRLFKIIGWSLLTIIVLLLLAVTAVLWYLTPEKLTPLVEREVTSRIDGRLELSRIELTFWSTFPHFELDVDSLLIISNRLNSVDSIDNALIPANADTLLSVGKLHGAINVIALARQRIELSDLLIERPRANIVVAPGNIANYDIFGGSDDVPSDSTSTSLPDITLNSFRLVDAGPITYRSIPDSLYLSVNIAGTSLTELQTAAYRINISGDAVSPILDEYNLTPLTIGLDGRIDWSPSRPAAVRLQDINITLNEISSLISADVDATDRIVIKQLNVEIKSLNVNDVINHLPEPMRRQLDGIDTDMTVNTAFRLTSPYTVADSLTMPSIAASVDIPDCHLYWNDLHLNRATLTASAAVDGENPDNMHLSIERLIVDGRAMEINARGTVDGPIDNPAIDSHLAMALKLGHLPKSLRNKLPVSISGRLSADTDLKMRLKDMTDKGFHKIHMDGEVRLTDFDILSNDSLLVGHTEVAVLKFGTDRTIEGKQQRIDSMLTASINIDTLSLEVPGLIVRGTDLTAALGTLNRSTSTDTAAINPFGGLISLRSIMLDQTDDSMTVRLRDMQAHASLTRFNGDKRAPQLHFDLTARRIGTRMPDMSIAVSQPNIQFYAHLIPAKTDSTKVRTRNNRRRHNMSNRDSVATSQSIDWNVSNDFKTLIKRWDINGHLTSNRAFIFTRQFPLRQRAADIDLYFNTDTVRLNSLQYNIGNTRLDIKGEVTNIERALTGQNNRSKLKIRCNVVAPFIDITQLANTTFYEPSGYAGPDPDYDEDAYYSNNNVSTDTTITRPVLIPRNIDADLTVVADSIKYADLIMEKFSGSVLVNNCAVNLHDLRASTDIGSASLSALYWAPDTTHMQFGMGMKLNRFYIDRVLSMIPAVDSLLPALQGFAGIINADLAASTSITPTMNIDMPSFKGALKLDGDSLVLLDADTFKMLAKWLVFKNKKRNMIDHMEVEIAVDDNTVSIYPFIFDIDRYKLGVMGRNDLDMNLDYHVSVLKSPLPFKFGINITGNLDDPKIKLGGAKIKPGEAATYQIADSTRVNLLTQIEDLFKRGAMNSNNMGIKTRGKITIDTVAEDNISAADSVLMRQEGFLPPDSITTQPVETTEPKRRFLWKK